MTTDDALAVVHQICDAHLCNAANRRTIDAALDELTAACALAATVDDTPAPNGRHAIPEPKGTTNVH
jgi:hypothetical protein